MLRIPNVQETLELTDLMYIDGLTKAQQSKARVKEGWTLLVGSNGNPKRVGNCVYVAEPRDFLFASFLIGAKPASPDRVDSEFLYRILSSRPVQSGIWRGVQGSTGLSNIDLNALNGLHVPIPPLPEQRKITAILSSVDDSIEKSQAVIDQVQVVKRGLMQDLLTRGLPGQHTSFKRTEIGELPKEWTVETVSSVVASGKYSCVGGPFGSELTRKDYVDSPGVPVIRGSNMDVSSPWLNEDAFVFVSDTKANSLQRNTASPGDLVFTQRGTLGQVCRIPTQSMFTRFVVSQSQMKITVDENRMNADFLLAYFRSPQALQLIERMTIGTGVPHLNLGILRAFPVPVPSHDEQRTIADYISATDARVDSELRSLKALKDLRSGLLSVLLTGEVRVMPDTEAA